MNDNTLAVFYFNIILRVDRMCLLNKTGTYLEYIILKVFHWAHKVLYWKNIGNWDWVNCIYWDNTSFSFLVF